MTLAARRPATALILMVGLAGCGDPKVIGGPGQAQPGGGGGSPGGAGGRPGVPGFDPGPAPVAVDAAAPPGAGETCAEEIQKAEQVPVDLLLTVDASGSMASTPTGAAASKYTLVRQALLGFVRDPASAGLGLGVQFFPQPGSGSLCQTNADCGYPVLAPSIPPCQPVRACAGAALPLRLCGSRGCPGGEPCVPLGRCSVSLADCTNLGEPCAGGVANDRCVGVGSACQEHSGEGGYCTPLAYEQLPVPIAALPAPGADLVARQFELRGPSGAGTPMRPAVEGALNHLTKHLQARPGRKGVMVLATDGVPSGCGGVPGSSNATNSIPAVAGVLAAARTGPAAISTWVVGIATPDVGEERMALQMLATAGGTGEPIVIGPMDNLGQRFLDALTQIRGQSLPCEFTIPAPRTGSAIDYGKVNVTWKGASGSEDVLYAGSAAGCDPQRGGWYYDLTFASGMPTRILACPATCQRFKADASATVEIRFGCRTRVID
jgi:hypothetical protein